MIGTSFEPNCFKKQKIVKSKLPIIYRNNRKAWMTQSLFKDYYMNCFVPTVRNYCAKENIAFKILLLLDNASR